MSDKNNLHNKITTATKWSAAAELAAKIINPLINMIFARLLAPEAFGIIASVNMIISFADMFTDSGFQKYLVQHKFKDDNEKYENANVAFWTNFFLSIIIYIIVFIFREKIAILVGNPGLGNVLAIACIQLPLTSFSSIQVALYRKVFDFRTLFIVRIISIFIPIVLTVPLAILGFNYWALIIGNLAIQISNAIIMTAKSPWKPQFKFSIKLLREMFSFSSWSLIEAISIWLSLWIDTFIIGNMLSSYYLGLYKNSTSMVNSLTALVTASIVPVLFSTLSSIQDDKKLFNEVYFKFQRFISVIVFPLGIGVYLYRDLVTSILLGNQWMEASNVIGIWALTRSVKIVFGNVSSEVYRSQGKPKLSFLAQCLHLIVLVPTCVISAKYGFWTLVYARSLIQLQLVFVHFLLLKYALGIPIHKNLTNVFPMGISAVLMGIFGFALQQISQGFIWSFISIILCVLFYFGVLMLFPGLKNELRFIFKRFVPQRVQKAVEIE